MERMSISDYRTALVHAEEEGIAHVSTVYNCTTVLIDDDGAIYISDPQAGHYLDDAEVERLMLAEGIEVS
jgi:hypothetical protein